MSANVTFHRTAYRAATLFLLGVVALQGWSLLTRTAEPAFAAGGTDRGPSWTATPIAIGGGEERLAVIQESENKFEKGEMAKVMAIYRVNSMDLLELTATRLIEYDLLHPNYGGKKAKSSPTPQEMKKAVEEKPRPKKDKDSGTDD